MLITKIIMVGIGGFVGSAFRFLTYEIILHCSFLPSTKLISGTLMVNILGCFLIGTLAGISQIQDIFSPYIRLTVFVGFLGGFTTFSTFGYELFTMAMADEIIYAFLYTGMHILLGFSAVALGFYLSTRFAPQFFNCI